MDWEDHLAVVRQETARFADVLFTADDLEGFVDACGGWSTADLARHLGGVHRWAASAVRTGEAADHPPGPIEYAPLHRWYQESAAGLLVDLEDAGPERACWTLAAPHTARFWARRQAHETLIHRWDAETSVGRRPAPIDPELALDGIDELVSMFYPRQVALGRTVAIPAAIRLVADDRTWQLGEGAPVAMLGAAPDQLLLALWGRAIEPPELVVEGDREVLSRFLASAIAP